MAEPLPHSAVAGSLAGGGCEPTLLITAVGTPGHPPAILLGGWAVEQEDFCGPPIHHQRPCSNSLPLPLHPQLNTSLMRKNRRQEPGYHSNP